MCGIAGIIHLDGHPASPVVVKRMTDALEHRGRDAEGQWIEGSVGIGHRRLAIIDPSPAGNQPMISPDHRFVLSYNGEVYNFRELRTELQACGVWFHSSTDSEVVLHALALWGVKALIRFNGMFALALWDRREKRLLLARDRYGIKPLYFCRHGNTLSFGSEMKAIQAQGVDMVVDKEALLEYFTFQNLFTDRTLLRGIHLLPAGHFAQLDLAAEAPALEATQYWDYCFAEPTQHQDRQEYLEELDRLFGQAVLRQLVSDVELGAYLSGGMDSGAITAIAATAFKDLKSFTCGFDLSSASGIELAFDERQTAEAMSARYRTEHYEMVLKAGDMERCLPKLAWHLEEPRVGQSYPNYYVAQLASKFVKVVLAGTGGDELFGGYPWRYYRAAGSSSFEGFVDEYYAFWQRLLSPEELRALFAPIWHDVRDVNTRDIFRSVFATNGNALERPEDYVNHSLYFEAKTFLHGLFVVEDKLSMAHGLETRVPFMDNDLVDFAMRCPVNFKLSNLAAALRIDENEPSSKRARYWQRTNDGKQILRDLMSQYVPTHVASAAKQGFSSPDASWFKGDSIEFVRRTLMGRDARIFEYFDRRVVHTLLAQHLSGERNRRLLIWSLLNLEAWLEAYRIAA